MNSEVNIKAEDHRLETQANQGIKALMYHRWHWTLDKTNPDRFSLRAYARLVERDVKTIRGYAWGYEKLQEGPGDLGEGGSSYGPSEALARAVMSPELQTATETVAQDHNIAFTTAYRNHYPEVRQVRDEQQDIAPVTSLLQEGVKRARKKIQDQDRQNHVLRYTAVKVALSKAQEHLRRAEKESRGVAFTREECELIAHTLNEVRGVVNALDQLIVGDLTPDWGSERLRVVAVGESDS